MPEVAAAPASEIVRKILILRGQRVLLDADLAALHETTIKALNQAVRRNIARFPADLGAGPLGMARTPGSIGGIADDCRQFAGAGCINVYTYIH